MHVLCGGAIAAGTVKAEVSLAFLSTETSAAHPIGSHVAQDLIRDQLAACPEWLHACTLTDSVCEQHRRFLCCLRFQLDIWPVGVVLAHLSDQALSAAVWSLPFVRNPQQLVKGSRTSAL